MKKNNKLMAWLLTVAMLIMLIPNMVFASDDINKSISVDWSGPCDVANKATIDIYTLLPSDAIVTSVSSGINNLFTSITPAYSENSASFGFTTAIRQEPASGKAVVYVETSNYDTFTITINITLTGKYIVNISAAAEDALYDGKEHTGFNSLKGTLTNGSSYNGDYTYTYSTADGQALSGAPTEAGNYSVTIAVPEDNENYKGSLTLKFSIISNAEVSYQKEENGEWTNGAFTEAVANVYNGGTIKLLKDINLTQMVTTSNDVTITSNDENSPNKITCLTDGHGYMLRVNSDVTLKNVIVDGGQESNITATRAMIAVGDGTNSGKLTLEKGAVLCNNKNVTANGAGGAVCVILGSLAVDGADIYGNTSYSGAAIASASGTKNEILIKSGTIKNNTATAPQFSGGGAVYASTGTITMSGGSITENSAVTGGAVYLNYNKASSFIMTGGSITKNNASYGAGICTLGADKIELSGGNITENEAEKDGGAAYIVSSDIKFSGSVSVTGNTCGAYAANVYLINNPSVKIGKFDDNAKIEIYTNKKPEADSELLIAAPRLNIQ